jgi:hypothetical protein
VIIRSVHALSAKKQEKMKPQNRAIQMYYFYSFLRARSADSDDLEMNLNFINPKKKMRCKEVEINFDNDQVQLVESIKHLTFDILIVNECPSLEIVRTVINNAEEFKSSISKRTNDDCIAVIFNTTEDFDEKINETAHKFSVFFPNACTFLFAVQNNDECRIYWKSESKNHYTMLKLFRAKGELINFVIVFLLEEIRRGETGNKNLFNSGFSKTSEKIKCCGIILKKF